MAEVQECDVLVIGLGGAGAMAAISATEAGASVIAVERTDDGGGSTRDSGGSIREFRDLELAVKHYTLLTEDKTPPAVVRACVEGAMRLPEWFQAHGGKTVETGAEDQDGTFNMVYPAWKAHSAYSEYSGSDGLGVRFRVVPDAWTPETGIPARGVTLWQVLFAAIEKLRIPVLYSTRANRLVQDAAGRVAGALCTGPAGTFSIHARKGVILCCGGFADDAETKVDVFGSDLPTLCSPGRRTGDGIRMAQAVGAGLWHMTALAARFGYKFPEHEASFRAQMPGPGFIFVDRDGRRYINEGRLDSHTAGLSALVPDAERGGLRRVPTYVIFDEETRYDGPIANVRNGYHAGFPWSRDNSAEVKKGWIQSADSIEALAQGLGLPEQDLMKTVREFNSACAEDGRDVFGRPATTMRAIVSSPFYGVPMWPCLYNTQGGPRRDDHARVLDAFGVPIPGLYSAGELGSMWSTLYPGAGNVTEALVFGEIGGAEAASNS